MHIPIKNLMDQLGIQRTVFNFNKAVRGMPTYEVLEREGHIFDYIGNFDHFGADSNLECYKKSVQASGYYKGIYADPVAQKELEHHFKETKDQAVMSSRESAALGVGRINIQRIMRNRESFALLQFLDETAALKERQAELEVEQRGLAVKQEEMDVKFEKKISEIAVPAEYRTLGVRCRELGITIPKEHSGKVGYKITAAHDKKKVPIHKVPSPVWGTFNAYRMDIMDPIILEEHAKLTLPRAK